MSQPAMHQVSVRGETQAPLKQVAKIGHAHSRRARHFFAAQARGEVGLYERDSPLDATVLRA
ncbi:MAG: hypothetical protein ABW172_13955 [Candidatus Binatia bacterium]